MNGGKKEKITRKFAQQPIVKEQQVYFFELIQRCVIETTLLALGCMCLRVLSCDIINFDIATDALNGESDSASHFLNFHHSVFFSPFSSSHKFAILILRCDVFVVVIIHFLSRVPGSVRFSEFFASKTISSTRFVVCMCCLTLPRSLSPHDCRL